MTLPASFCDPSLSAAFEGAEAVACRQFCQSAAALHPGVSFRDGAGGVALFYAPSDPLNGVKGVGMSGPVDPREWSDIESLFHPTRSPITIDLSPMCDPPFLTSLLKSGYTIASFETVTFRPVRTLPVDPVPNGVHIERIPPDDQSAVDTWERTLNSGFANGGPPIPFAVHFGRARAHTILSGINPYSFMFLATVAGKPAGGAALSITRAVPTTLLPNPPLIALMSGAAVLPEFRRRGIQSALTSARLAIARTHGCDYATIVVQAGSGSHRNACRAGFFTAYSRPQLVSNLGP